MWMRQRERERESGRAENEQERNPNERERAIHAGGKSNIAPSERKMEDAKETKE